eukprot:9499740-Pyramimonas_sp.AAC.1
MRAHAPPWTGRVRTDGHHRAHPKYTSLEPKGNGAGVSEVATNRCAAGTVLLLPGIPTADALSGGSNMRWGNER